MGSFLDPFTRADNATTMGAPWSSLRGTFGISSNQAYLASASLSAVNLVGVNLGEGDGIVQADVPALNGTNGGLGIMFRATDANNHYIADFGSSAPQLFKGVAGAYTGLGTFTGGVLAAGDTIRVTFFGSRITCWRLRAGTWSQVLSVADTTWDRTLGTHGLYIFSTDFTSRVDNFSFVNPLVPGHGGYGG